MKLILKKKDPLGQLNSTDKWIETYLKRILNDMKGLKLKITFKKPKDKNTIYKTVYLNSKTLTIKNDIEIEELLKLALEQIIKKIAQWLSEESGWVIQLVDKDYLNIVSYMPMTGSSYIKLPKELQNSAKGLINLQNKDNKCFRWCHIRHISIRNKKMLKESKHR